MRNISRICIFAFVVSVLSGCSSGKIVNLQSEINVISTKWAPDKRVDICDIRIKDGKNGHLVLCGETTIPDAKSGIIKTLGDRYKNLYDSIIILPDTINNKSNWGVVTLSVINMRKDPDDAAELVSQARLGTPVQILKKEGSNYLIRTPDKYIAWTDAYAVKPMTRAEINEWKKTPRVIYLENTGWLKDTTSISSGVTGDLVCGCIMAKCGENGKFVKVELPDGRKGFIEKEKVMDFDQWKTSVKCTEDNIISRAKSLKGLPYLWGGTSAKAVDCSGFVQTVYFMNGYILSRDASLQALYGSDVDISDGFGRLKKGDLLFFGRIKNGKPKVTHVAIYTGNNEYINASARVRTESFDSTQSNFRTRTILSAKRIIGAYDQKGIIPVKEHSWY